MAGKYTGPGPEGAFARMDLLFSICKKWGRIPYRVAEMPAKIEAIPEIILCMFHINETGYIYLSNESSLCRHNFGFCETGIRTGN